ncbi:transcriptional repressor TCF25-domain-containing protein [Parachaetomium inaequale]|uniref:Transcriptional repressor TCF25-domain-containing protein n=1 Tax=Parachaetomium inaequale TaxID=2588326 RepID=A0AAN6SSB9_9PEZI|nr:transcriptional repressor TCF25-domain-containing protein [Parachaetomium inaequale]
MASRQLRKLRKQQELLSLQNEAIDRSEESEDEPIVAKPRANMFSGFAALGDDGDGGDDDEEDQESEVGDAGKAPPEQQLEQAAPAKKKKPKKKKKKGKQAEPSAAAQDERESIDEIDRVLAELKLEAQQPGGSVTTPPAEEPASGLNELLRINFQHLKALNEMRRLFGRAMDVAEVEERTQDNRQRGLPENLDLETFLSARAAHPGQGPQSNKSMFDTILRTNPFIDGKKTWPRGTAQGLKMVRVTEGSQDEVEFAFAHDSAYDALEGSFFSLVQMYDPMQIVHFLHRHPYHISSLIQVSKVARQDQNSALAADLIERALFTFGRVSLNEFRKKLEKGQARLSFARPENRQFHLAGYNLIQKLVLKGTYRTALEWAKLFLSINHDDPYSMINWIHVLAIRAREAEWFINFCNSSLFNNNPSTIYAKQTLPLAHFQLGDPATAKSTLTAGMQTLPWLYCALFSALNLDTPKPIWGIQPRDPDEALHTELYIHTTKDLWNTPQHISLLKEAAAQATIPQISTLPPSPSVCLATARFVYLDNTPSLMSSVPRQMLHTAVPNFDFDPLPPAEEENIFSSPAQRLAWTSTEVERARGMQAAVARLREEIEREVQARVRRRRADAERRGEVAAGGEGGEQGEGEGEQQGRERRFLPRGPPAPGIMNYLRYLMEDDLEVVDQIEEWQVPTGMPGGWGQGEGWEEEGDDDFEGEDEFEGADDFEGEDGDGMGRQ